MQSDQKKLKYEDYTVAIVCPLEVEMTAMRYLLDEEHARLPGKDNDRNRYILGRIGAHNVAIAYLPQGSQGIGAAATVATDMRRTFTSVQLRLLVGIGGGIPSIKYDIRLGDVVVGMPDGIHGGVVQYDLGKRTVHGFEHKGFLCAPPDEWRTAVVEMKSDHEAKPNRIAEFLSAMMDKYPKLRKYSRPASELDCRFPPESQHVRGELTCDKCDRSRLSPSRDSTEPEIFYGTIASGDSVIKDPEVRDHLSKATGGALCFEMEAAGMSGGFPCLVIRGIADYADSHKNDQWHPYAAAVAAACAKELLTYVDPLDRIVSHCTVKADATCVYTGDIYSDLAMRLLRNDLQNTGTIAGTIAVTQRARKSQYYRIPTERKVRTFVGRKDVLENIDRIFAPIYSNSRQSPISLALIGMGGMGKTQVVLEYCHQAHFIQKRFASVFWVNAYSREAAVNSLAQIANDLGFAGSDGSDLSKTVNFVLEVWNNWHGPYLIIFDNFDDPQFEDINAFVPPYGSGAILFTTRLREVTRLVDRSLHLSVMNENEAIDLLSSRSGILRSASNSLDALDEKEVVRILEYLPLALDQAGAYIRSSDGNMSFKTFLEHYEHRKKHILEHVPKFWQYRDYANEREKRLYLSVITTWELSLKHLGSNGEDHENKVRFLTLASFLGGHRVAKVLFKTYLQDPDSANAVEDAASTLNGWAAAFLNRTAFDDDLYRQLVVELNDLSLIRGFAETSREDLHFSIHSLVQEWARLRLWTPSEGRSYTREAMNIMQSLFEAFQTTNSRGLDIARVVASVSTLDQELDLFELRCGEMFSEIASHVQACIRQANLTGPELDGSEAVELHFATFLQKSDVTEASNICGRIIRSAITIHGHLGEKTLEVMERFLRQGAYVLVMGMDETQHILELLETAPGAKHPLYMLMLSESITLLAPSNDHTTKEFLSLCVSSLKEVVDRMSLDHKTSSIHCALSLSLGMVSLGQFDAAQTMLDRVKVAFTAEEGVEESSPSFRLYKQVTISLLYKNAKPEELQKFLQQCIEEDEQGGKRSDAELMIYVRGHLAHSYASQQRWKDAVTVSETVLASCSHLVGPLDIITQYNGILTAYYLIRHNPEDLDPPIQKIKNIIEFQKKHGGVRRRQTVAVEMRAAIAFKDAGQHRLSYESYRQSYLTHRQWLSQNDSMRLGLENDYAMSLTRVPDRTADEVADITAMFKEQISFLEGDDDELSSTKLRQADFWFAIGYYEDVLGCFQDYTRFAGHGWCEYVVDRFSNSRICTLIASCYRLLKNWGKAMSWYDAIIGWQKKQSNVTGNDLAPNLIHYANACKMTKTWAKAEEAYQEIVDYRNSTYGQQDDKTIEAQEWLAGVYCTTGDFAKAEPIFQQILTAKKTKYGEDNKRLIKTLTQLVNTIAGQNTAAKLADAETHLRRALHITELHEGMNSKGVCDLKQRLSYLLGNVNKWSEVIPLRLSVLDWHEANNGHDSPATINSVLSVALAYSETRDWTKAFNATLRVVNWRKLVLGNNHEDTLKAVRHIGNTCVALLRLNDALPYLMEAADGYMALSPWPKGTIPLLDQLAVTAKLLGRWDLVEKYCLCLLECIIDADEPDPAVARLGQRYEVAVARLRQGRAAEAEHDIAEALHFNQRTDPSSLNSALSCYWYAECQTLPQKTEVAAEHYALFISYQGQQPEGEMDSFVTWGIGWEKLQLRAWEELRLFYSEVTSENQKSELITNIQVETRGQ